MSANQLHVNAAELLREPGLRRHVSAIVAPPTSTPRTTPIAGDCRRRRARSSTLDDIARHRDDHRAVAGAVPALPASARRDARRRRRRALRRAARPSTTTRSRSSTARSISPRWCASTSCWPSTIRGCAAPTAPGCARSAAPTSTPARASATRPWSTSAGPPSTSSAALTHPSVSVTECRVGCPHEHSDRPKHSDREQ